MGNSDNNHEPLPLMECELNPIKAQSTELEELALTKCDSQPTETPSIELNVVLRDKYIVITNVVSGNAIGNGFSELKQLYDEVVVARGDNIHLSLAGTPKKIFFRNPVKGAVKWCGTGNYKYCINLVVNSTIQLLFGLLLTPKHVRIDMYFLGAWYNLERRANIQWTDTELIIGYN